MGDARLRPWPAPLRQSTACHFHTHTLLVFALSFHTRQQVKGKKAATITAARRSVAGGNNDKELQQVCCRAHTSMPLAVFEKDSI